MNFEHDRRNPIRFRNGGGAPHGRMHTRAGAAVRSLEDRELEKLVRTVTSYNRMDEQLARAYLRVMFA